jgi:2-C-methyl-D-erythritol 4-phosphate cytidylyltransferase/2-C-methyl-D-erythritol 2,4-cyclodiphosphate synthase
MTARRFALIPAAGQGIRAGAQGPKQYRTVAGAPMLVHAVRALLADPRVDTVFVVLAADDEGFASLEWGGDAARVAPLYCGGPSRRDSVFNGLVAMANVVDPDDWVLVHDAARPCLERDVLARLIDTVSGDDVGGLLALPVADTLKRGGDDARIVATEPRAGRWGAQTPQMFRHGTLLEALGAATDVTDEAAAVERLGLRPVLVPGSTRNLKVTFPDDFATAERLLEGRTMRIGQGFDVHALVEGRPLVIGGVTIPFERGLLGHSDADVLLHAVTDALLGAAALGDIGRHFPDTDARYRGADSRVLLREAAARVRAAGYAVVNVDATIVAQAPRMAPHIPAMVANIAADLGLAEGTVNVKAKTTERLGFAGRGEGIAAEAIAALVRG